MCLQVSRQEKDKYQVGRHLLYLEKAWDVCGVVEISCIAYHP